MHSRGKQCNHKGEREGSAGSEPGGLVEGGLHALEQEGTHPEAKRLDPNWNVPAWNLTSALSARAAHCLRCGRAWIQAPLVLSVPVGPVWATVYVGAGPQHREGNGMSASGQPIPGRGEEGTGQNWAEGV